jgi:methylenetetrahydrofolate dehydrogenase (NADP+)/methenyltetrahydrofolate cyclohydrolase
MILLDGKQLSQIIQEEIGNEVRQLLTNGKRAPHLCAVLVGEDPASRVYVRNKIKSCEKVGFQSTLIQKETAITEEELLQIIKKLNEDPEVDGFIVQLPLPDHINELKVTLSISPQKDVDGFHPMNVGRMSLGLPTYLPATPNGIMTMLERFGVPTEGKNCVVLGRSNIVGTPMSILLSRKGNPGNATVELCHSRTSGIVDHLSRADIIVAAIGKPEFVRAEMVKEGAVVIDVGINRVADASKKSGYRLTGDVAFEEVAPKCSFITPVPGGVGPMTVTSLLLNTLKAYKKEFDVFS